MMIDNWTAVDNIAVADAKRAALAAGDTASTEDRLRAAMRATKNHWLFTQAGKNDGRQLRAAVAGVCLALGQEHPDYDRIAREHRALAKFSAALEAAQKGVAVDFAETLGETLEGELAENPIGLLKLWRETTEGRP